jgi:uncharacterized repeat protein (TIGR01451 family)
VRRRASRWALAVLAALLALGWGNRLLSAATARHPSDQDEAARLLSNHPLDPPIRLLSRTFVPQPGAPANAAASVAPAPPAPARVHVLVQFRGVPTAAQRQRLTERGVRLLDYVPENAFFASLPGATTLAALEDTGVHWLGPILPEDKLPPRLRRSGVGRWAVREGGEVELRGRYFADVGLDEATRDLEALGARDFAFDEPTHTYSAVLPEAKLKELAAADWVRWVEEVPPPPMPFNDGLRANVRAEEVQAPPYELSGAGVVIGQWDSGAVDTNHLDLTNRVVLGETNLTLSSHATHVAGTLAGDGHESEARGGTARQWRGIAPAATIVSYSFENPVPKHTGAIEQHGIVASQNSWGHVINPFFGSCGLFGDYAMNAPQYDQVVIGQFGRPISVVFAAGNLRGGLDTNACGVGPYRTIGPPATAKNLLAVGSVDSDVDVISEFSGWGPLEDGRLKPDLVAPGAQAAGDGGITSTAAGNAYRVSQGTSMATPAVSGALALLVQDYRARFNGQNPPPALLKALLLHTAADVADRDPHTHKGPDFASGYGRLQIQGAVDQLRADGVLVGQVAQGQTNLYVLEVPEGTAQVKLTLVWDDPPAAENAALALVNDLDLLVLDPNQARAYPWTLDPENPAAPAVQSREDHLNVVEQVQVDSNPTPGVWSVQVIGRNVPVNAPQKYSLAFTPTTIPAPATTRLAQTAFTDPPGADANGNGWIDPGEVILLAVRLQHTDGPAARNLLATLSTTTPGVAIVQAASAYPDLLPGESGVNSTPFAFHVAKSVPCGTPLNFTQELSANGYTWREDFTVAVGSFGVTNRTTTVFPSADVPGAIPDGGALSSLNHLDVPGTVQTAQVTLRLDHTWIGDLRLELVHPDGATVRLKDASGEAGRDFGAGACDATAEHTRFADAAAVSIADATAPFVGAFRPVAPLSLLRGRDLQGDWRLRVSDTSTEDTGTLLCWELAIDYEQSGYTCNAFNRAPVALGQSVTVIHDAVTPVRLSGADGDDDVLSFALLTQPAHGTLSGFDPATGAVLYTPTQGYSGPDSFTFHATDGAATSTPATVELTVREPAADLALSVTVSADPALVGAELIYAFTITNLGPNPATRVRLVNRLPPGLALVTVEVEDGTSVVRGRLVLCEGEGLAPGAHSTVRITMRPTAPGPLVNIAEVEALETDENRANNTATATITAKLDAALAITKVPSVEPAFFGVDFRYELAVSNLGPNAATGVQIKDVLPAGLAFVSAESSQGACVNVDGQIVCDLGELTSGASGSITLTVTPVALGEIRNTATVTAEQIDPDLSDNLAASVVRVEPLADLAIRKEIAAGPAVLDQELRYIVTVTNEGPNTATGVRVVDSLPPQVTLMSVETTRGSFSQLAEAVTFDVGTLENGATATLTMVVLPTQAGLVTNSGVVTALEADPRADNNAATLVTEVKLSADLGLLLSVTPQPVLVGETMTYWLTVTNAGPYPTASVRLTNVLDGSVNFVDAGASQGTCANLNGTVVCELGALASGSHALVAILASPTQPGPITHVTTVADTSVDPDPANNTITHIVEARLAADLAVSVTASPEPVLAGAALTYAITVSNAGPADATQVVLTDLLPAGASFVSAEASEGTFTVNDGQVRFELGELAAGAVAPITLLVSPTLQGPARNVVTVASAEYDPRPADNAATSVSTVIRRADLTVTQVATPQPALLGGVLTYNVTVRNRGPHAAERVTLFDMVLQAAEFVSAHATQGSCAHFNGTIVCEIGDLPSDATATLTLAVRPRSLGDLLSVATVTAEVPDPQTTDNSASLTLTVAPAVDLAVEKLAASATAALGHELVYELNISNAGPSTATGVLLTDALPAGLEFIAAESSQGACANADGTITCDLGELAAGAAATVRLTTRPTQLGVLTNSVTVGAAEADRAPDNNAASAVTQVKLEADVGVTFEGPSSPVLAGAPLPLSATVVNHGPNPATAVVLNATLPASVTFVSTESGQGSCAVVDGELVCELGELASGQEATVALTVVPNEPGAFVSVADVSTDEADLNPANNRATTTFLAQNAADLALSVQAAAAPAELEAPVRYTLDVRNLGPHTATGLTAVALLPAEATFLSAEPGQGTFSVAGQVLRFELAALAPDARESFAFTLLPTRATPLLVVSSVVALEADLDQANNFSALTIHVRPAADLNLTLSGPLDPVAVGHDVSYRLQVANQGPHGATGVVVREVLPEGVTFGSAETSQGTFAIEGRSLNFALGDLPAGEIASMGLVVRPTVAGLLTNEASVAAHEIDRHTADNSRIVVTQAKFDADLALTVRTSPGLVLIGRSITYQFEVRNRGPHPAAAVSLTQQLPETASSISVESSQGTSTVLGSTILTDLGALRAEAAAHLTVTATPTEIGPFDNAVRLEAEELDPTPADNALVSALLVHPLATLMVTQIAQPNPVLIHNPVHLTVTVANQSPYTVPDISVTDELPEDSDVLALEAGAGVAVQGEGLVSWTLGELAKDSSVTLALTILPRNLGRFSTRAVVASPAAAADDPHLTSLLKLTVIETPTLYHERLGNRLLLSWAKTADNFVLEATSDLAAPNGWTLVRNPRELIGDRLTVTVKLSGDTTFFRLRKQ